MSRETGEIFLETCKDNKRDKPTLEEIIVRRVRRGTHVITDCWAAYGGLEELGPSNLMSSPRTNQATHTPRSTTRSTSRTP